MFHPIHPEICKQIATERHERLLRTAHVARLVRQADADRQTPRRHRRRH
jgi:hypothetical protein